MNKFLHKTLIFLSLVMVVSAMYLYFAQDLNTQAATVTSSLSSSSLSTSAIDSINSASPGVSDKISQDIAFLSTLTSLTRIKIDTSIFSDQSFGNLKDNTVLLEEAVPGRPNPFAPIDNSNIASTAPTSPVVTDQPTQVTEKSALLAGIVSDTNGVTTVYFDYGPTPNLGSSTKPAKLSLIGTFVTPISLLKSKTAYFFRAVAKINGVLHYGEVISFTTN